MAHPRKHEQEPKAELVAPTDYIIIKFTRVFVKMNCFQYTYLYQMAYNWTDGSMGANNTDG